MPGTFCFKGSRIRKLRRFQDIVPGGCFVTHVRGRRSDRRRYSRQSRDGLPLTAVTSHNVVLYCTARSYRRCCRPHLLGMGIGSVFEAPRWSLIRVRILPRGLQHDKAFMCCNMKAHDLAPLPHISASDIHAHPSAWRTGVERVGLPGQNKFKAAPTNATFVCRCVGS